MNGLTDVDGCTAGAAGFRATADISTSTKGKERDLSIADRTDYGVCRRLAGMCVVNHSAGIYRFRWRGARRVGDLRRLVAASFYYIRHVTHHRLRRSHFAHRACIFVSYRLVSSIIDLARDHDLPRDRSGCSKRLGATDAPMTRCISGRRICSAVTRHITLHDRATAEACAQA